MTKARYIIESESPKTLIISDVGTHHMSITNDAEGVVKELHENNLLMGRRLYYYDSDGRLDELKHDGNGKFTGFAHL